MTVTNPMGAAMPFQLVIFGPCTNPAITIGGNRYELAMTIPVGARVTIDSQTGHKTITMTDINGDTTNVFDKTHRDQASNEYAFATLPPGLQQVSWDESFGFDVEYWLEQTGLPWT